MNKQSKLKLLFLAVALFVSITVYSVIFGNPLFEYFARNTANRYIADNYPGCYISEITYDIFGIFGGYKAIIKSEDNVSYEKTVYMDLTGLTVNHKAMKFFYTE